LACIWGKLNLILQGFGPINGICGKPFNLIKNRQIEDDRFYPTALLL